MSRCETEGDGTERFPDDAPEDLDDLVSVQDEHEFERLSRDVEGEPYGGATWRSDDEEVCVMNYAACGYWAVEASAREYDDERGWWVTYRKSNGAVDGLDREEAFRLADAYMSGEIGLTEDQGARYAFVGCGAKKREPQLEPGKLVPRTWPAEDLYTSTFFRKKWEYAGLFDDRAILSAEHGILYPSDDVEPYDTTIEDLDESELAALADEVRAEIEEWNHHEEDLQEVAVLAGKRYIEPLRERGAFDVGPEVTFPLQEHDLGGIGEQMGWLTDQVETAAVTDGGCCVEPDIDQEGSR